MISLACLFAAGAFAQENARNDSRTTATIYLETLTLKQAESLFAEKNRELLSARRAVESAEAQTISAGQRPNPQLSLGTVSINPSRGIGSGKFADRNVDSTVRIDQLFERGGKRGLRIASAQNLEDASREDFAATGRSQRIQLHAAFFDLLLAQQKVQIAIETQGLFAETLRAADLRLHTGDVAAADVARIRVDALRGDNDARQAEADRIKAQSTLAYMLGAETVAKRVRAAQLRVDAAQAGRDLAKSMRTRDISVGVQYEHYPPDASNTYGFGVSFPLFVNYHYEGEIKKAEVDLYSARDGLERVRAQARGEAQRTLSDLRAAQDRLQRFRGSLMSEAARAADGAEFAYKNGAMGVMDLLDSRRVLRAIQVDAATAQADFAKALSAWEISTGSAP